MKGSDPRELHERMSPPLKAAIRLERPEHLHTDEVVAE
jgi:hypothetical protein